MLHLCQCSVPCADVWNAILCLFCSIDNLFQPNKSMKFCIATKSVENYSPYSIVEHHCLLSITSFQSTPTEQVMNSSDYYILRCDSHVVTLSIISYSMILIAYPLALYTFRVTDPEHLSSLAETVSGSFSVHSTLWYLMSQFRYF